MFAVQIVLGILFLAFGLVILFFASEGEARPFMALFSVIWTASCLAIIFNAVRALRLVRKGRIQVAEMEETERQDSRDFARKLRELEALRAEGILTQAEYENKRAQIMGERW
ncbi:Short C-terminal domain-containing protein [Desulfacinum infernum DSM 9756]|uniref:Short C-terminal domain-containing protein n=1 Tax=Desulfacinum infernum DSM 9756 TaxID=1121391 RepID=A0A1M4T6H7_9BACT|nr:Short C-terminal domain-containing protein [Desulfacinum infernum DSM 9756]